MADSQESSIYLSYHSYHYLRMPISISVIGTACSCLLEANLTITLKEVVVNLS